MLLKTRSTLILAIVCICSFALNEPVFAEDDLFQDAGSWLQIVGESSLKYRHRRAANPASTKIGCLRGKAGNLIKISGLRRVI